MRQLLLPCETRSREFDAKLLLAVEAARRGISSVVGSKKVMDLNLSRYAPGVYVGKSVTARSRHNLQLARACGHRVALWDEEGLVWASREVYWRTKVDGPTLAEPERLLAWGETNAAAWCEHPDYKGTPIAVTGNPRTDLLRPELRPVFAREAAAIAGAEGPFILINTNFSRVNHVQPRQNRHLKWLREQRPEDPRGGFAAHKFELFSAFRTALPELAAALPDITFVLRPHPSEQVETWTALARDLPNVRVRQKGNVVPWILASRGLVHNGCTTAVEAFALGRPALAFMPVRNDAFDHPLPNGLSEALDDSIGLVDAVARCHADPDAFFRAQCTPVRRALLDASMAGMDGPRAGERILDELSGLLADDTPPPDARPRVAAGILALRRLWRPLESRIPGQGNHRRYLDHMFPPTTPEAVAARVALLGGCLNLAPLPRVRALQANVFRLSPGDAP